MLFIYRALAIGGIETFFVRMAKERNRKGLHTKILLTSKAKESDPTLLNEIKKYAQVFFIEELLLNIPLLVQRVPVILPVKRKALIELFKNVDQIHVSLGIHALLGHDFIKKLNINIPITVGFYHYNVYVWGNEKIARHVKINREFIFTYLPKKSLLFFSEGNLKFNEERKKIDLSEANTFRLGVVDKKNIKVSGLIQKPLRIIAVGRLEEFKTYNLYMLDVVRSLLDDGISVQFDIFGNGSIKYKIVEKIKNLGLQNSVFLKGELDYIEFDETVSKYDMFIGSGTAIIQAAALGVPSIVGVENVLEPTSYGFFSYVHMHEYNLKDIGLPMFFVKNLIKYYLNLNNEQRLELKNLHANSIKQFTNYSCQKAMDELRFIEMPLQPFKYNRYIYSISVLVDGLRIRISKNHPYNRRHLDFKR